MNRPVESHLSPDDIDVLLTGVADTAAYPHLEQCRPCQALLAAERHLVARLESLTLEGPSPEFADIVMSRVSIPDPFAIRSLATARRRLFATRRSLAAAAMIAVVVVASMAASAVWTLGNRETLAAAGSWIGAESVGLLWLGLRGVVANFIEQPWYGDARQLFGDPARVAAISGGVTLAYVAGLLALRRLMALPAQGVANAHA